MSIQYAEVGSTTSNNWPSATSFIATYSASVQQSGVQGSLGLPELVPEDAICMEERASAQWVPGDPHVNAISGVVTANISKEIFEEEVRPYVETYNKWKDECLDEIKEALQGYFPDRWEVIHLNNLDIVHHLKEALGRTKGAFTTQSSAYSSLAGEAMIRIVIHFPELLVSNDVNSTLLIKDFYVKIYLDYKLSITEMTGYRATKSYKEHLCDYNFSHVKIGNNSWTTFCFGHTSLDTLVAEMRVYMYNQTKMDLLLQNLTDYLSWESIDGVPYYSIENVKKRQLGAANTPQYAPAACMAYYRTVMATNPKFPIILEWQGDRYTCEVPITMEYIRAITPHVPEYARFPIDDLSMTSIYRNNVNVKAINRTIGNLNADSRERSGFRFKGEDVNYTVELLEEEQEEEEDLERLIDIRLARSIAMILEEEMSNYLHNKFWHGIKEGSIQQV